ncbi:hypothetical protein Tco_1009890 [Tanacetum coccineum]
MQAARDRQKSYADLKRKPMEFQVGDKVMLKVSPWKRVVHFGKRGKLNPRYVGPFKVLEKVRSVAYKLELPEELSRVHNTFHVSNLKKCHANEPLAVSLDGLHFDDKLQFVEEPVLSSHGNAKINSGRNIYTSSHSLPLPPPIILSHTRPVALSSGTPPLHLLSTDHRVDKPEVCLPPRKRLCSTQGPRYKIGESSVAASARPIGGRRADYGFVGTIDTEIRRQRAEEVGYRIRDVWVDPREAIEEVAPMTLEGVNTRVTELVAV